MLHMVLQNDHPFSTYAKFFEKLTFLTPWYTHVRARIRNVSFLENFAYILNEWSLCNVHKTVCISTKKHEMINATKRKRKTKLDQSSNLKTRAILLLEKAVVQYYSL